MKLFKPLFSFILVCFCLVIIFFVYSRERDSGTPKQKSKLRLLVSQNLPKKIYIGIPVKNPKSWLEVNKHKSGDVLISKDGQKIPIDDVKSYLVTYPSGEILSGEREFLPLPEGIYYVREKEIPDVDYLTEKDLEKGKRFIKIIFGPSESEPTKPNHYSTSLENISKKKIKVTKFAGYTKEGEKYRLNTITKGFFSAQQFIEWYGVKNNGWILPGEIVKDPNNYGGGGLWAYFCTTEDGDEFIVGALPE